MEKRTIKNWIPGVFFKKCLPSYYIHQNVEKLTDYNGFVNILLSQKSKQKIIFLYPKTVLERLIDVFNDLYYTSVNQTLILSQILVLWK